MAWMYSKQVAVFEEVGTLARIVKAVAIVTATLFALQGAADTASAGAGFITPKMPAAAPAGAQGICQKYGWACEFSTGQQRDAASTLRLAKSVNQKVNRAVQPISDQQQYRREEFWTLPTSRGGDCEDYVLLKKKTLLEAGVPARDLLIATVLDHNMNNHAVLIVRTTRGDFVLDNLTNRILPWEDTGYTFLRMQNPKKRGAWDAIFAGGLVQKAG